MKQLNYSIIIALVIGVSFAHAAPKNAVRAPLATNFLSKGNWRTPDCSPDSNFQKFSFVKTRTPQNQVEVGNGELGTGEALELLNYGIDGKIAKIETRVCAPVGCNHTYEQYKIIDNNHISEWSFIGKLPDQPPLEMVKNGVDRDGKIGRVFTRCAK